jgi:hypothetical protein
MPNPKGHEDSIKDCRFKAAWQSGPTRTIRVPITLAEVTLEYARRLDSGIEARDTSKLSGNKSSPLISQPRDTIKLSGNESSSATAQPRDTIKLSGNESSSATAQPRDTKIKPRSQAKNPVGSATTAEARDTQNLRSDAADLLNRLKAKRKKSSTTLADVEMLLELLEG